MLRFMRKEDGGVVLESALILPLYLSFLVALIAVIQVAVADMALRSAVGESAKVLAAGMYPAGVLIEEAANAAGSTPWGQTAQTAIERMKNIGDQAAVAGQFIDDFAAFVPEPVAALASWIGTNASEAGEAAKEAGNRALCEAMKEVVLGFADDGIIKRDRMRVTSVSLPVPGVTDQDMVNIEAQVDVPLRIPFFNKTITLTKHAGERAWIGA